MSTIRVKCLWSDLPEGVTAYHILHGVERAVRRERIDLDTMIISRSRPYGVHEWHNESRVIRDYITDPTTWVEVDAVTGD